MIIAKISSGKDEQHALTDGSFQERDDTIKKNKIEMLGKKKKLREILDPAKERIGGLENEIDGITQTETEKRGRGKHTQKNRSRVSKS